MQTRTSKNWLSKPGKFDLHNSYKLFPSNNQWEIPNLLDKFPQKAPDVFIPFTHRLTSNDQYKGLGIHFFLDDYRFESVWTYPDRCLEKLKAADVVLGTDFSLWLDFPYALQIYNTYRNMWLSRYWQEHGIRVVPTASWSDKNSYEFSFCGIPKHSPVAVSNVGINKKNEKYFYDGFEFLLKVIDPIYIICYGSTIKGYKEIKYIDPIFLGLRGLRCKENNTIYAA